VESARRLGRAQAAPPAVPEKWWSTRFLADYVTEWNAHVDWSVLDRDDPWAAPLIRAAWGPDFRPRLRRFHQLRPRLLSILDALPRVFCHLDFWPANLFSGPGELVAVDWAFAGEGAPGEDVGNLLPDTAFDLVLPARTLAQLVEPVFDAYAESCPGDRRLVRLGMLASAVKYVWLPVGMLAQARAREHAAYGGNLPADSETLYRERGLALEMLFDWAEAAVRLADELAIA
jgi:thiamine kinase-like enzyme